MGDLVAIIVGGLLRELILNPLEAEIYRQMVSLKNSKDTKKVTTLKNLIKDLEHLKKIEQNSEALEKEAESIANNGPKKGFRALEEEEAINGRPANEYRNLIRKKSMKAHKNTQKLNELQDLIDKYTPMEGGSRKSSRRRTRTRRASH